MDGDEGFLPVPERERADLHQLLQSAFPAHPVPLLGLPTDLSFRDSHDVDPARQLLRGKAWSEVALPEGIELLGPFYALGPEASLYHLPGLAAAALHDPARPSRAILHDLDDCVRMGPVIAVRGGVRP